MTGTHTSVPGRGPKVPPEGPRPRTLTGLTKGSVLHDSWVRPTFGRSRSCLGRFLPTIVGHTSGGETRLSFVGLPFPTHLIGGPMEWVEKREGIRCLLDLPEGPLKEVGPRHVRWFPTLGSQDAPGFQ